MEGDRVATSGVDSEPKAWGYVRTHRCHGAPLRHFPRRFIRGMIYIVLFLPFGTTNAPDPNNYPSSTAPCEGPALLCLMLVKARLVCTITLEHCRVTAHEGGPTARTTPLSIQLHRSFDSDTRACLSRRGPRFFLLFRTQSLKKRRTRQTQ
jgi:hypothetical protein